MPQVTTASRSKPDKRIVLTLRVDEPTKRRLHSYSMQRARKLGRAASYNECLVHLIHEATAR